MVSSLSWHKRATSPYGYTQISMLVSEQGSPVRPLLQKIFTASCKFPLTRKEGQEGGIS